MQYQYRPGSISGYISRVLAGHADRRRSEFQSSTLSVQSGVILVNVLTYMAAMQDANQSECTWMAALT